MFLLIKSVISFSDLIMDSRWKTDALDFIINILKIHEKTLDNSIDRFDTTVERLENVVQEIETMIIRERYGSVQIQIQEVLTEVLGKSFSL